MPDDKPAPGGTPPPAQPLDARLLRQPYLPPARPALAGRADGRGRPVPGCAACGGTTIRPVLDPRRDQRAGATRDCRACRTTSVIAWTGDAWAVALAQ